MTPASDPGRRRVLEAMGLGPLWVRRAAAGAAVGGAATSPADRDGHIAAMPLVDLRSAVEACTACGLSATRTRTVFGTGPERPEWMVIGEAPGADEDQSGEPFVGQAGRLLDAMLRAAGFSRDRDVFIANTVKCRPPGNRNPSPDELASCRPFLMRQIELLDPRIVLAVGRIAANALLGRDESVAQVRGKVHRLAVGDRSWPMVVTYHPAYLLRTPADKGKTWIDLCLARSVHREDGVA